MAFTMVLPSSISIDISLQTHFHLFFISLHDKLPKQTLHPIDPRSLGLDLLVSCWYSAVTSSAVVTNAVIRTLQQTLRTQQITLKPPSIFTLLIRDWAWKFVACWCFLPRIFASLESIYYTYVATPRTMHACMRSIILRKCSMQYPPGTSITRPPSSLTEGLRYVTDAVRLTQRPRRGASRRLMWHTDVPRSSF
jgi:hypothetical protein